MEECKVDFSLHNNLAPPCSRVVPSTSNGKDWLDLFVESWSTWGLSTVACLCETE